MYVEYEEYVNLKYTAVSEEEFPRYQAIAEQEVRRYTQNRISCSQMNPPDTATEEVKRVAEMNRRGVCEIIDAAFAKNNPNSNFARKSTPVSSFSNSKYSETRAISTGANAPNSEESYESAIGKIIAIFFTPNQRWRGMP